MGLNRLAGMVRKQRGLLVVATVLALVRLGMTNDRDRSSISQSTQCGGTIPETAHILPVVLGSPILDFRWVVPQDKAAGQDVDKVILALSEGQDGRYGGHVYRSDNFGKIGSWRKINDELKVALPLEDRAKITSADEHELGVLEMHFNSETPHRILLHGSDQFHWSTFDFGMTFRKVPSPGGVKGTSIEFKLHPLNQEYIAAKVRSRECTSPGERSKCTVDLYVSQDFGASWTSLLANSKGRITGFVDFDWGAKVHPDPVVAKFEDKTIFATVYEGQSTASRGQWDQKMNFVRSDDFFTSNHETYVKCGNAFEIVSHKIFLAVPSDCPYDSTGAKVPDDRRGSGQNANIFVSEDFGRTFSESCVPVKYVADNGYELRETHDGQGVMVLIDHDEEEEVERSAPVFNLYNSGMLNATLFSLSLERVFSVDYYGQRLADWHRVEGLPGIYIANQLEVGAMSERTMRERGWKDFVESLITFNGGGHWQHLQAPTTFRNPKCNLCAPNQRCLLHLHGASSWVAGTDGRPSVYSHPSAPGVLMASGNTGSHLDFNPDFQCTWLSRDGGYTWEDVAHGMFIYEYGDHGGLILMARHRNQYIPTDTLYYSYDQGLCWNSIKLAEAMYLENIRVEPRGTSHTFVLHGEQCENGVQWTQQDFNCTYQSATGTKPKGLMYVVDFSEIRKDWSNCLSGDFEEWSAPNPDLCLLGQNLIFERRKREAKCFNGKPYMRPVRSTPCKCGLDDVECEYGYFRSDYLSKCERIGQIADDRVCPALDGGYVMSSTFMRLIHGDTCTNPASIIPDFYNLKPQSGGKAHKKGGFGVFLLVLVLVLATLAAAFAVYVKMFASDDVKEKVQETCSPVLGCCGSCFGLVGDWFRALFHRFRPDSQPRDDSYFHPLNDGGGDDPHTSSLLSRA